MFAVSKKIITNFTLIASLLLSGLAQAATTTPCLIFINAQDYARAETEAKKLIESPTHSHEEELAGHACLGMSYMMTGRLNDALLAMQKAEALAQDTKELAGVYPLLAALYLRLNEPDRAILYSHRARKVFRDLGHKAGEGMALVNLGEIERTRGNTKDALKLFSEALPLLPEENQGAVLNNIAVIHLQKGEPQKAIPLFRKAIEIDSHHDHTHAAAKWRVNLGTALGRAKQYSEAKQEILAGLEVVRLVGDKATEAEALSQLGYLAAYKKNPKHGPDEARQWLEKAGMLYREIGDTANADDIAHQLAEK